MMWKRRWCADDNYCCRIPKYRGWRIVKLMAANNGVAGDANGKYDVLYIVWPFVVAGET